MPFPVALSGSRSPISRRAVLVLGAAAGSGVAACSADSNKPAPAPSSTSTPAAGPDPQLADLRAERELLRWYDATIAAHPALRSRLLPLRRDHEVHVSALARLMPADRRPRPADPVVPADQAAALGRLRTAEQTAAAARGRSCLNAAPERCGLLGSIAASESSHVELLA